MLKVKLVEKNHVLCIEKYEVTYPFSSVSYNDNKILWNLNSFECKGIKGNFRLLYSKKIDFSGFKKDLEQTKKKNLKIVNITNCHAELSQKPAEQYILFVKRALFYINEKNISFALNSDKKTLPHFLLLNEDDAKKNIQFFISYEEGKSTVLNGEEITFYLNLFQENE